MKDILIIGGGGHAKVIASVLRKHSDWNPIGYTDVNDFGPLLGLPYLGTDQVITNLKNEKKLQFGVIGIGQLKKYDARKRIIQSVENYGLTLPPILSENAIINENANIGSGTVVMDGVIIQPGVRVGKYSIVNTGTTIDHDCEIGDFVHIAPGVNISGDVVIGNCVLVGVGASLIQGVKIVSEVIIGAGAVVTGNIGELGTYVGVPARIFQN